MKYIIPNITKGIKLRQGGLICFCHSLFAKRRLFAVSGPVLYAAKMSGRILHITDPWNILLYNMQNPLVCDVTNIYETTL